MPCTYKNRYKFLHIPFSSAVLRSIYAQVIAILVVVQHMQSWFRKHDDDAATFSERMFERPRQLEKVRKAFRIPVEEDRQGQAWSPYNDQIRKTLCTQVPIPSIFSEATKSLTIVIPAYNEERRLPSTLEETFRCATCAHYTSQGWVWQPARAPLRKDQGTHMPACTHVMQDLCLEGLALWFLFWLRVLLLQ